MRALRVPISVLAGLALAALSWAPATAQAEEPPPVVAVTGTVLEGIVHNEVLYDEYIEEEMLDEAGEYGIYIGGPDLLEQTVEWSDPRLPTKHWMTLNYVSVWEQTEGLEGAWTTVTTHLLEDDSGRWTGQGRLVVDAEERYSFYTLTGEGAYEGLYALLRGAPDPGRPVPPDMAYEGYIFEGDVPAFPLAPTPVTTPGVKTFPAPTEPPAQ